MVFKLLEWHILFDICLKQFFSDYNDSFKKIDGIYVFVKKIGKAKLENYFLDIISTYIKENLEPFSIIKPEYLIITGSCKPKNNLLFSSIEDNKISIFVENNIDYYLSENDIDIDIKKFNELFDSIFDKLFKSTKKIQKILGEKYKNIIFIRHSYLDSNQLLNLIENLIYGKVNCKNLGENYVYGLVLSVNDYIREHISDNFSYKDKDKYLEEQCKEIKQFLDKKYFLC